MTTGQDLDRRLSAWLSEEGPQRTPERLIHTTRARLRETSQIGSIRRLGMRFPTFGGLSRPVAIGGLSALVLLAVVFSTGGLSPSVGGPGPSPAPSSPAPSSPAPSSISTAPGAAATPFACPAGRLTCAGPLGPGTYTAARFTPTVRYTVPSGWINLADRPDELDLEFAAGGSFRYADGIVFYDGLSIFRRPAAESAATPTVLAGVGATATDLADWLMGHAGLVATGRTAVTINGASGYRLQLALAAGPNRILDHCTADHQEPRCASLFISADRGAAAFGFGLVGPETVVIYLLDAPSGDTVIVVIDDPDGVDVSALVASATPIVESLEFVP